MEENSVAYKGQIGWNNKHFTFGLLIHVGRVKRKGVFEYAQNAQIQIHSAHAQKSFLEFVLRWYIL